jgi:hypothetical protein
VILPSVGRLAIEKSFAFIPETNDRSELSHLHLRHTAGEPQTALEPLQCVGKLYHALALIRIGQWPAHGAEIVGHVQGVGGAGDYRSHPLIAEQIL